MIEPDDVGALIGEDLCDQEQLTRCIRQFNAEGENASAGDETGADHRGDGDHVDVATGDDAANFFIAAVEMAQRSQWQRARGFDDEFVLFEEQEHGFHDLCFADGDDAVDIFLHEVKGQIANLAHSDTFCAGGGFRQRRHFAALERKLHAGSTLWLYASDANILASALWLPAPHR